jgi:hypothetical protein
MQERLAAMQRQTASASSPEEFWQRMQSAAGAPAPAAPAAAASTAPAITAPPVPPEPAAAEPAPAAPVFASDDAAPPPPSTSDPETDQRLAAIFGRPGAAEPAERSTRPQAVSLRGSGVVEEPVASHYLPPDATAPILELEATAPPAKEEKKRGLLGGIFGSKKDGAPAAPEPTSFRVAAAAPVASAPAVASSPGRLAAFANALMAEYNSGQYGKQRLDERMNVRLRLVDEQADPLDRMLPLQDDRLDAGAIDREFPADQAAPYLATLVRQIFEDAERVFGKDKAKKGYRAAIRNGLGGDESVLRDRALAEVLPKV